MSSGRLELGVQLSDTTISGYDSDSAQSNWTWPGMLNVGGSKSRTSTVWVAVVSFPHPSVATKVRSTV